MAAAAASVTAPALCRLFSGESSLSRAALRVRLLLFEILASPRAFVLDPDHGHWRAATAAAAADPPAGQAACPTDVMSAGRPRPAGGRAARHAPRQRAAARRPLPRGGPPARVAAARWRAAPAPAAAAVGTRGRRPRRRQRLKVWSRRLQAFVSSSVFALFCFVNILECLTFAAHKDVRHTVISTIRRYA